MCNLGLLTSKLVPMLTCDTGDLPACMRFGTSSVFFLLLDLGQGQMAPDTVTDP